MHPFLGQFNEAQIKLIQEFVNAQMDSFTTEEQLAAADICLILALNGHGSTERTIKALKCVLDYAEFIIGLQKK